MGSGKSFVESTSLVAWRSPADGPLCISLDQLGAFYLLSSEDRNDPKPALESFTKALVLDPTNASAVIMTARIYLSGGHADLAHGLLNPFVQGRGGWDTAEAWYYLAQACRAQGGREERVSECTRVALALQRTRTCRPLYKAVEAWLG